MKNVIGSFENTNFRLSDEVWKVVSAAFITQRFPRGSVLLMQGDINDKLYFVEEGVARAYYEWDEKEYTSWFAQNKQFACSIRSFFTQTPSFETIHLLEASTVSYVRYSDISRGLADLPEVSHLMRILAEQYLLQYESRVRTLRGFTARQRFDHFVKHYPSLYNRVPLQHIASYLDLTPSTVSRLRAVKIT